MVKSFQSRFVRLQRLREQQEQTARTILAARLADLQDIQRRETEQRQHLEQFRQALGSQMQLGLSGSFLTSLIQQINLQEQMIAETSSHRHNAELLVQIASNDLRTANVELKTLNELVDRERILHRADVHKQIDSQLQEQAAHAWQRRRVPASASASEYDIAISEEDESR